MDQLLQPGTILRDRYQVIALVGQGGMGAVYQAEDVRLEGRRCALKEVQPVPGASERALAQAQEQFRQEASTLARLDHPNLPKVSDYFSHEERDYLIMDFVAGQDLKALVDEAHAKGRFLSEQRVLGWISQVCDALSYLHSQESPILHRDIKPANIRLTPQGVIKLVDFGLVKPMDADDPNTISVVRGLGTLPYTPLEQYSGGAGHTDARSDIYSLGATLYHLLTGRRPANAQERFLNPQVLKLPREINPAISARTEDCILWAMAMHPDRRPPSVEELRRALFSTEERARFTSMMPVDHGEPALGPALQSNMWLVMLITVLFIAAAALTVTGIQLQPVTPTGPTPIVTTTRVPTRPIPSVAP
ncbi:MAG: serine/threonine protein kinase [Chloroflexi bacterium]|nr:serine/threonine protein kinase [Chloroflexota bacterium]MBU1750709.1 serine/threonine protein kinase [Chloroflexota bacterium]